MAVEIPLKQALGARSPKLVCDERAVEVVARSFFKEPCTVAGDDIAGVVDLTARAGVAEPVWKRAPVRLYVRTGTAFAVPNLMLVFRRPPPASATAPRRGLPGGRLPTGGA